MTRHIIRRLIQAIPTLFGITILSYFLMAVAPGSPVRQMTFDNPDLNPEQRQRMADRFGLNDPWYIQYITWLAGNDWQWWLSKDLDDGTGEVVARPVRYGILRGDFGTSIKKREDVMILIAGRVPATLELGIATLLVAIILGIPIGIGAAVWRGGGFDNFSRIFAVLGQAIPNFWFGLMLFLFFGSTLNLAWARGDRCSLDDKSPRDPETGRPMVDEHGRRIRLTCGEVPLYKRFGFLILPTIVGAYGGIAGYSRFMRTSMLDTVNSDYIRTARAKGLPTHTVWFKHAARNALIPIATFLGPAIVGVLSNSVVVEQVFNWPGLGLLLFQSVVDRDYPIIMASVVIGGTLTVIAYIISDVLYAVFDPRIRF